MQITEIPVPGYHRVAKAHDPKSGLHAIIAVHDLTLGPALGGMRMWKYENEDAAKTDVLRLAKGMTYKSAIAQTGLGGGKSVLIGDAATQKTEALFRAMGKFIESFGGEYITAEDVNTSVADLEIVRRETKWVTGLSRTGGSSGNPSPYTARGCFLGMRAVLERAFKTSSPRGLTFAVQGVGAVGSELARMLVKEGARVRVSDVNAPRAAALAKEIGVEVVPDARLWSEPCDVISPCALGGIVNDGTLATMECRAVAGCANNQLLEPRHGDALAKRGVLYAPDYVINAGGIINVGCELLPGGYREEESLRRIDRIYGNLVRVFDLAERETVATHVAADRLAEEILAAARTRGRAK